MALKKKTGQSDQDALFDESPASEMFDFDYEEIREAEALSEDYDTDLIGERPYFYSPSGREQVIAYDIAPAGLRLVAFGVDVLLIIALAAGAVALALKAAGVGIDFAQARAADGFIRAYLVLISFSASYFILLQAFAGKTVGKMLLGIRVIAADGEILKMRGSFVRFAGYFVSAGFLFLGFLWAIFDSKGQAWHDKIARTYVVKD